jgi:hypothetical protein
MATVEFETPEQFLAELSKDRRFVDRKIVRVASQRRGSFMSSAVAVTVVGTARVGSDLYRVECVCGGLCGVEASDRLVITQVRKQLKNLRAGCTGLGLDVRSGVLE